MVGSALGGVCRYGLGELLRGRTGAFPLATLLVNVIGCYLIALINEATLAGLGIRPGLRLLLTTGFCGGFTTYSTFNYEAARLFEERRPLYAAGYFAATAISCLLAHGLGLQTIRALQKTG
jgi:CrcB protein